MPNQTILLNMYNFYKKRYSTDQSEMEKKFNDAVEDLINTGDISKIEYTEFCVTHDIEPKVKKTTTHVGSSTYTGDSCGSGGRNYGGRNYGGC